MNNKNVAVVWGGYSSEAEVSERSMQGICKFLDKTKYNVYPIQITRHSWSAQLPDGQTVPVDKNDFSICLPNEKKIKIDFAYITIHGTPGEDGLLQGYLDMINMPYSTCNPLVSALTFDKYVCNHFIKNFGISVPKSILVRKNEKHPSSECLIKELGLPLFVKPATGGSSYATTKVKSINELLPAIDKALQEAPQVVVEQYIEGKEFTCGCYSAYGKLHVLPITEIITENDFFDYAAKYNGQSQEITPARISPDLTQQIKEKTAYIYKLIDAKGIIRIDYILTNETLFMLEINTTPGMTATSFIPQQVHADNKTMSNVLTDIIESLS